MKIFTVKQRLLVLFVTLSMIGLFAGVGYVVGRLVGDWRAMVALGVLISYPFTQFALYRTSLQLAEKEQQQEEKQKQTSASV